MTFGANATVTAAFGLFATDAITIVRKTPSGGQAFPTTTQFDGKASLQEGGGQMFINPGGAQEVSDALLVLRGSPLPDVKVNDIVTRTADGKKFVVVSTSSRTALLPHLECLLKRGPLKYEQK